MNTQPKQLARDPIVEAIAQIRFQGESGIGSLLPGLLFEKLRSDFPNIERLPMASMPVEFREANAELKYQGDARLHGDSAHIIVGEHVVTVGVRGVYPGWAKFRDLVVRVWGAALESKLIHTVERYSVKYVNLLDVPSGSGLSDVADVSVRLGSIEVKSHAMHLKAEIRRDDFVTVVQIVSPAEVEIPGTPKKSGIVIDIDTISEGKHERFFETFPDFLDRAHLEEKRVFYSLLTPETLERYEPQY